MKFLVLSVLVCAASAATFPAYNNFPARAFASASVYPGVENVRITPVAPAPVVQVAKAAPVVNVAPVSRVRTEVGKDVEAVVLRSDAEVNPDGYSYNFETSNGIAASSSGVLKKVDDTETLEIRGQYQYVDSNGEPVQVTYIANEFGYQPDSAILPKAHPIPEAIARSLEYIASHAPRDEYNVKRN